MIHGSLWTKEVRGHRRIFLLYFLLAVITLILFPYISDQVVVLPGGIRLWEGITASTFGPSPWISWFAIPLLQFSSVLALLLGYSSLAGELDAGTTSYLLSKPVSRREIVTTKIIAGLTMLVFFVYGLSLIFVALLFRSGFRVDIIELFLGCTVTFIICAVIYITTVLFSSFFTRTWTAGLFSAIFWGLFFALGLFEPTRNYSIIYHLRSNGYWEGQQAFIPIGIGIFIGGLFGELANLIWEKREY